MTKQSEVERLEAESLAAWEKLKQAKRLADQQRQARRDQAATACEEGE